MKRKIFLSLLLLLSLCSCNGEKHDFIFEAEDAALENCSIEKIEGKDASNDALVGFIKKGSRLSFGIQAKSKERSLSVQARVSFPLQYKDDGSYPTAFLFSDLYLVTLNDEEVKIGNDSFTPEEKEIRKDNYYAFVTLSFDFDLKEGSNILSFSCISSSNEATSRYASIGNFDCLTFQSRQNLSFFKPDIPSKDQQSHTFQLDRNVFFKGEAIQVKASSRPGHEKDWLALLPYQDMTSNPVSSYYLSKEEKTYDLNPGLSIEKGNYKVCLFKDDSYELMNEFPIFVCENKEDMDLFSFKASKDSILVKAKQREEHTKDWIALYRESDRLGKIGSLYYYYPEETTSEVDITTKNRNTERKDMELSGRFKLCYCKGNSYDELLVLYFYLS